MAFVGLKLRAEGLETSDLKANLDRVFAFEEWLKVVGEALHEISGVEVGREAQVSRRCAGTLVAENDVRTSTVAQRGDVPVRGSAGYAIVCSSGECSRCRLTAFVAECQDPAGVRREGVVGLRNAVSPWNAATTLLVLDVVCQALESASRILASEGLSEMGVVTRSLCRTRLVMISAFRLERRALLLIFDMLRCNLGALHAIGLVIDPVEAEALAHAALLDQCQSCRQLLVCFISLVGRLSIMLARHGSQGFVDQARVTCCLLSKW